MSKKVTKAATKYKGASTKPSSTTASPVPKIITTKTIHSFKHAHVVQSFVLVWLDENITDDCHHLIDQLKSIANTIDVFNDVNQCIDFLNNARKENIFLVVTDRLQQQTVSRIHQINSIAAIFVFCESKPSDETWKKKFWKIRGEFTEMTDLHQSMKATAREIDEDSIAVSFLSSSDISSQSLDELNPSFMYTQLIKEILLQLQDDNESVQDLVNHCREKYADDVEELKYVNQLEQGYRQPTPIWWYTSPSFIYSMLNRALYEQDFTSIIRMGFFIRDLHQQITQLHKEQTANKKRQLKVFRGHGMSRTAFEKFKKTEGGLIAFDSFLSTSRKTDVAQYFLEKALNNPQSIGVFFTITGDPSISSAPFANVDNFSYFQKQEEEILFSMHTIFRIERIEQNPDDEQVWNVNLTLTSDNDKQLNCLIERMREEIEGSTPLYRLGALMIRLGDFKKAEEMYRKLLETTSDELEKAHLFYQLGQIKYNQENNQEANSFYQKALEIYLEKLPPGHQNIASTYNNMGLVSDSMNDYSRALVFYQKACKIYEKELSLDHPIVATCYNNIASAYDNNKEYEQSLKFYEKAFHIYDAKLPPNHPHFATYYSNIGLVHYNMRQYSKALSYFERAIQVGKKALPDNHPDLEVYRKNLESARKRLNE